MSVTWQANLFGTLEPSFDDTFAGIERIELSDGAWVDHLPGWLQGDDVVMDDLVRTAPWKSSTRPMYDRIVAVPRLTAWWEWKGEGPAGAPPILESLRAALSKRYSTAFTSCGCNLYRDGSDSVAWHGDRIKRELVEAHVAIVSVGEPRKLLLRPTAGGDSLGFKLGHGDLFVMGGTCQRTWQHSVPKCKCAGPRMSITFRHGMRDQPQGYRSVMAERERDPHKEPENSTVDDWHGQEVDRMKEQAEDAMDAAGGDAAEAEAQFKEGTTNERDGDL
jgi:alkylated DNA repair dioxygenase AlkB